MIVLFFFLPDSYFFDNLCFSQPGYSSAEILYNSGSRYYEQVLYQAGMCSPLAELPVDPRLGQELAATRSA
jgi:hypothetical protein